MPDCTCDLSFCHPCDTIRRAHHSRSGLSAAPANGVDNRHPARAAGGPVVRPAPVSLSHSSGGGAGIQPEGEENAT